jgi:hypothetical protein
MVLERHRHLGGEVGGTFDFVHSGADSGLGEAVDQTGAEQRVRAAAHSRFTIGAIIGNDDEIDAGHCPALLDASEPRPFSWVPDP